MTHDEVIRKAAALLRLAARPGTAGEAAAAAGLAQNLLDRWNLTRDALNLDGSPEPVAEDETLTDFNTVDAGYLDTTKRLQVWRWMLANKLSRLRGCYLWHGRRGAGCSFEIVGRPSNVEAVRYLFAWLARETQRLTDQHGRGLGATWRREFAEGCAKEIGARMEAQHADTVRAVQQEAPNPHALVCVNRAVARLEDDRTSARELATTAYRLRSSSTSSSRTYNGSAREAGRRAAGSVNLRPARGSLSGAQGRLSGGGL